MAPAPTAPASDGRGSEAAVGPSQADRPRYNKVEHSSVS